MSISSHAAECELICSSRATNLSDDENPPSPSSPVRVIDLVSDSSSDSEIQIIQSSSATTTSHSTLLPASTIPSLTRKRGHNRTRSSSSPIPHERAVRQRTLFDFGAKRITSTEAQAQQSNISKMLGTDHLSLRRQADAKAHRHTEQKREQARLRQQECRRRKKEKGSGTASDTSHHPHRHGNSRRHSSLHSSAKDALLIGGLPELSRPGITWKKSRNGKNNGIIQLKHTRINYFNPFLWSHISRLAPRVGWSSTMIASILKRQMPDLFGHLYPGTIHKWLSKSGRRWSKHTLAQVKAKGSLKGTGRVGILTPFPTLVAEITAKLVSLRATGVPLDRLLARSIMMALVKDRQPQLLDTFKCTEVSLSIPTTYTCSLTRNDVFAAVCRTIPGEQAWLHPSEGYTSCSKAAC